MNVIFVNKAHPHMSNVYRKGASHFAPILWISLS